MTPWLEMENGERVWEDFSALEKELLVKHYAPQIRYVAYRMKTKLPKHIDMAELISAGTLGLMESLKKYQADLGIRFETYAESRIRGAMLDELRRLDWFSRGLRQRVRQIDEAMWLLEQELGRTPTIAEVHEKTGLSEREIHQGMEALQSQLAIPLDSIEDTLANEPDRNGEPFHDTVFNELSEKIATLIDRLTDKEKLVLSLYYTEELNMREVAEVLGVTEGRVSQLHSQAISRLRREFSHSFGENDLF